MNTSASPSFWQVMPMAPASICMAAIAGILWVLMCGRLARPGGDPVLRPADIGLDAVEVDGHDRRVEVGPMTRKPPEAFRRRRISIGGDASGFGHAGPKGTFGIHPMRVFENSASLSAENRRPLVRTMRSEPLPIHASMLDPSTWLLRG